MQLLSLATIMLYILAALAFCALLLALFVLKNMFIPTRGKQIGNYPNPTKVLLVLDIQESGNNKHISMPLPSTTPFGKMVQTVNCLIESFDQSGQTVAYVRQVFSRNIISRIHGGRILSGTLEPQICRWITVVNTNDFAKSRTDAFSNKKLEQLLIDQQVDEVFLVGLDAAFCVYYTALGALNRGYRVTVITDAVMTGRDMVLVMKRYREKGIRVMNSHEVELMLARPQS